MNELGPCNMKLTNEPKKPYDRVKRWFRKGLNLFEYDLILVPINITITKDIHHWCLAVIEPKVKSITYYDSLGGTNTECLESLRVISFILFFHYKMYRFHYF